MTGHLTETPIQRAERLGFQQVAVTSHDLFSALTGHPIMVSTLDGVEVCLRLMTADEFMDANRRSIAKLFPDGGGPAPCTYADAERVTRPLDTPGGAR